ncbi:MAG: (Fe-S)-binding protein [Solirubrobacteraceae bacterium]
MRVALFITCIGDTVTPEVGRSTVAVLERLGHEVVFPAQQTCCGQMHLNSGYRAEAGRLGARFLELFDGYEVIVSPSSSCVGTMRECYPQLHGRLFELSELLVGKLGVTDVGATFPHRVVYHPTCHSLRVTNVGDAPYALLRAVAGLELVELEAERECCGFGGTFALKNADTSTAMVIDKCAAIVASGASVVTAVDSSCLLQIGGRLSREGAGVRAMHLAEILAQTASG